MESRLPIEIQEIITTILKEADISFHWNDTDSLMGVAIYGRSHRVGDAVSLIRRRIGKKGYKMLYYYHSVYIIDKKDDKNNA